METTDIFFSFTPLHFPKTSLTQFIVVINVNNKTLTAVWKQVLNRLVEGKSKSWQKIDYISSLVTFVVGKFFCLLIKNRDNLSVQ